MKRPFWLLLLLTALPLAALPRVAYIGMSAAVPGSGQIALGRVNRGGAMLGIDLVAAASYLAIRTERDDLLDSYRLYAQTFAGAPITTDENYYQHVREYLSSDDFNRYQEMMARNYYLVYSYDPDGYNQYLLANTYSDAEGWHWQSEQHQRKFRDTRSQYMKLKLYQNGALGALFLNRLVSLLDIVFITRSPQGTPFMYFTPDEQAGLMLNYQWEF